MKNSTFLLALIVSLFLAFSPANAATFTVSNTDDSGAGSLRQAILDANSTTGADVIEFSTSGTLTPATALPTISESVSIDGTTATGYAVGTPTFHIDYSGTALTVNAGDVSIDGLDVSSSGAQQGIGINFVGTSGNNSIKNCNAQNRGRGINAGGAGNFVIENNDLTGTGPSTTSPALVLNIAGTVSASSNTFGGTNANIGLYITNMDGLSIGNQNTSPTPNIIIEDNSGLNTLADTPIIINASLNISIEGVDLSKSTTGQNGIGINFGTSGGNNSVKNCNAQNRKSGIKAHGAGNFVIENNDLTGTGHYTNNPALHLNAITGTVSASSNTFGGTNANFGLIVTNMDTLSIGNQNTSPTPDIVIEDNSGLNTITNTPITVTGSNISIEGIDVSKSTTGQGGVGINIYASGDNNSIKNCNAQNRGRGINAGGAGNFVIENNDLTGTGPSTTSPALVLNIAGTVSASNNTFGGTNANVGLYINNMDGLSIGNQNTSPIPDIVIEDNSGLNTLADTPIIIYASLNISIEDVDVSKSTTGQNGIGISFGTSGGNNSVKNCNAQNRKSGIKAHGAGNFVIENNDLTGTGHYTNNPALHLNAITGTVSASNNTFGGANANIGLIVTNMDGLSIGNQNTSPTPDVVIEDNSGLNTIENMPILIFTGSNISIDDVDLSKTTAGQGGTGLNLGGSGLTIQNVLTNNRTTGITIHSTGANSITCSAFTNNATAIALLGLNTTTIENNTFACITSFAINNITNAAITAENNFWESESGPTNEGGSGPSYNGDVDALPFLSDAPLCAPGGANYCANLVSWSVADITTDCDSDGGTYDVCYTAADLGSVIGLDVSFTYPSQLTPVSTDFITLKDLALNTVGGDASQIDVFSNSDVAGEVSASVYFNSSAPLAAVWNGGGEFICFTFELSGTWDGTALTEIITTTEIFESYETSVSAKGAEDATLEIITMIGQINVNGDETTPLVNGSAFNGTTEITTADENCTPDGRWTQGLNTATDGGFSIAAGGSANVRITRNTAQNDLSVIGGSDALRAVFIRLGLGDAPTLNELLAMDVNGDGFASAGDITNILRRSVGLIADYPTQSGEVASDWKFALSADMDALEGGSYDWKTVPVLSQCMAVPADACAETVVYDAVLKGDVVSSWTAGSNYKTAAETSLIVDVAAKHTLEMETTYRIPVYAQDIESFFTLDLDLPFDASKVSIQDVVLTEIGESYDIQFVWNTPEEGRLMMASYTIQEIDTDQPLFEIIVSEDVTGEEFGAGTSYFNGIASNVEVIDATAVGIEDILGGSNSLTAIQNVHPNPANNVVMIDYNTELTGDLQVQVMDLAGRTVAAQTIENNGRAVVDISTLQNGLYIVTLSEDGQLKGRAKVMVAK